MKLNIIDCRNRHLDSALLQESDSGPISSSILSSNEKMLSEDIKAAIQAYITNKQSGEKIINISIESNNWVNKEQAAKLLEHAHLLIKRFFAKQKRPMPSCCLFIFENNKFISIKPNKKDKQPS